MTRVTQQLALGLIIGLVACATAQAKVVNAIISTSTHRLNLSLNEQTVLCSEVGYGSAFLKILIPQLADITIMDHRNEGADAPCVAAGNCAPRGSLDPKDILDPRNPKETVDVTVTLTKRAVLDPKQLRCTVELVENIDLDVRGVHFTHERGALIGERNVKDCR